MSYLGGEVGYGAAYGSGWRQKLDLSGPRHTGVFLGPKWPYLGCFWGLGGPGVGCNPYEMVWEYK